MVADRPSGVAIDLVANGTPLRGVKNACASFSHGAIFGLFFEICFRNEGTPQSVPRSSLASDAGVL